MKIIKPLRLSVLNRPFRLARKNQLGVTVLALADMGEQPQLRPEMELWQLAAKELQTSGGVVDLSVPKSCAEFLATGYAFTRHQQDKTQCPVRIDIGDMSKTLLVSGDRYWAGKHPTPANPFDEMRLDWSRAFGGQSHEENPHGLGSEIIERNGVKLHPLPNIEALNERVTSPKQKPEPASFGALDFTWPRRFKRAGKQYDNNWLRHDFPGFAQDTDWRLFNAAPPDQWWNARNALPPQANWRIWNMHPEKPVQQGVLPPWQARCFINRQRGDEILFEEVPMRATTVWFFPHLEQMILIWHGSTRINEDDAADVLQLMPALEKTGASRSQNHYRKVLRERMDKERGALFAFREKDLIPEDIIGPWIDNDIQQNESPMRDNMQNRVNLLKEQHRARLEGKGGSLENLLEQSPEPEIPKLDELPEFIEKMERQAKEMQEKAEQRKREMEARRPAGHRDSEGPRGPESMHRMLGMLEKNKAALSESKLAQTREQLHKMYLMSAQHQPPALRLTGDLAQIIRQRAERTQAQGGDFSGMDLTGCDLSGMDLRGANFTKALLECADLSHCTLDGAKFNDAVLARAELHHTSLRGCDLTGANLALAQCCHSDFSASTFKETTLQETLFDDCEFSEATLEHLLFYKTWMSRCRFHRARLDSSVFMELTLPELDFSQATLHKVTFLKSTLEAAVFSNAALESCSWVETQARQARFNGATLVTCAAAMESTLNGADFSDATLVHTNLRQTALNDTRFVMAKLSNSDLSESPCHNADFTRANLAGSNFIRTDFRKANFTDANLMEALLQKCQLGGAIFNGANLFRTDISQSFTDGETRLGNAWTKRIKILPERDGEIV